jgi:hypothetical protein
LSENGQNHPVFSRSAVVTVNVSGYAFATGETRCDNGKLTLDAGKTITEEPTDDLGPTFTVEVRATVSPRLRLPKHSNAIIEERQRQGCRLPPDFFSV